MKKFIIRISIFIVLIITLFVTLLIGKHIITNKISWKIDSSKHTIFMGASHIERGIDISQYPNSINLANSSERYMFTYLKLKNLFEQNQTIDTLFLQFAPTDMWLNTDVKYFEENEQSFYLTSYNPFFSKREWNVYSESKISDLISLLLSKTLTFPTGISYFGGFHPSYNVFDRNKERYAQGSFSTDTTSGHTINYTYLNEIVNLCEQHQVKLYFIYMPVFEPEKYYDQEYFYNTYKKIYSDINFLDYNQWDCPDDYRADEHHLNNVGARQFTKQLYDILHVKMESETKSY